MNLESAQHLSTATSETPDFPGTFGESARILVKAIVSRSSGQSQQFTSLNDVIMLVDRRCPYVFLTEKAWKALGVKVDDLPKDEACVKTNAMRVLAHAFPAARGQRYTRLTRSPPFLPDHKQSIPT
jgi:hypothetical protein